jgi:hypothetical protein
MREHAPFLLRLILATASANDVRLLLLLLQQGHRAPVNIVFSCEDSVSDTERSITLLIASTLIVGRIWPLLVASTCVNVPAI